MIDADARDRDDAGTCNGWVSIQTFQEGALQVPRVKMTIRYVNPREFWHDHWIGYLCLLPAVVMLVLHESLGITDAFLMGDRVSADYNLMTFAALILGSMAFVVYVFALPIVKGRGWEWVPPKIIHLVFFWGAVMLVISCMSFLHL
jgi:hypothetical protein